MEEAADAGLAATVAEAVAGFDAANLAWGQFYQQIWRPRPEADRLKAEPVREALGEVALAVPAQNSHAEIAALAGALQTAAERLRRFMAEIGQPQAGDLSEIPETLLQAREALLPFLR